MNSKPQPLPLNTDNGAARLSDQVNAQLRHPSQTAAGSENDLDEIEAESPWTSEANHQWHKLYHVYTKPLSPNPQPSFFNPQPSTLNPHPSILNPKPSTLNPQPSTLIPHEP